MRKKKFHFGNRRKIDQPTLRYLLKQAALQFEAAVRRKVTDSLGDTPFILIMGTTGEVDDWAVDIETPIGRKFLEADRHDFMEWLKYYRTSKDAVQVSEEVGHVL